MIRPATIDARTAILSVSRDYVRDRAPRDRDEANELQAEAIAYACALLGVSNPEEYDVDEYDALIEDLDDGMRTPTDDSRSNGPHQRSEY